MSSWCILWSSILKNQFKLIKCESYVFFVFKWCSAFPPWTFVFIVFVKTTHNSDESVKNMFDLQHQLKQSRPGASVNSLYTEVLGGFFVFCFFFKLNQIVKCSLNNKKPTTAVLCRTGCRLKVTNTLRLLITISNVFFPSRPSYVITHWIYRFIFCSNSDRMLN